LAELAELAEFGELEELVSVLAQSEEWPQIQMANPVMD
jgi:hypothetical protein